MSIGDKQSDVEDCVQDVIRRHGWTGPFDRNGTMGGVYQYQQPLMISFHRKVAKCLKAKHYSYIYPETNDYMRDTLAMALKQIYVEVSTRTGGGGLFTTILAKLGIGKEISQEKLLKLPKKKIVDKKPKRHGRIRSKKKTAKSATKRTGMKFAKKPLRRRTKTKKNSK